MRSITLRTSTSDWLLAVFICGIFLCCAMAACADLAHWFVIPVSFCGILMLADAVAWARGQMDIFDPNGLLGVVGTHFFFFAPLLQIYVNYRTLYGTDLPDDYRPWLGGMAVINAVGLLLYRRFRNHNFQRSATDRVYSVDYGRFSVLALITASVSLLLHLSILSQFGGISGFVDAVAARTGLDGLGLVLIFTETFPIVVFMWFSLTMARRGQRSWVILGIAYAAFLVLVFLFSGLRGSRGNTVYAAIWGAGIIHFYNRRLNRLLVGAGVVVIVGFMYAYGFYKDFGKNALTMFESTEHWAAGASRSARTPELLLLGDFGRSDVQALILYRLMDSNRDVPLAWGRTYLAAAALAIPQSIWPERPAGKTKYLTDLESGTGTYQSGGHKTSHVAGVTGEAMLNFGWLAGIGGLALLGVVVRTVRRCVFAWTEGDARRLVLPYLICLLPMCLLFDADNLVFELARNLLVPGTLILVSSRYSRVGRHTAALQTVAMPVR